MKERLIKSRKKHILQLKTRIIELTQTSVNIVGWSNADYEFDILFNEKIG